MTDHSIAADLLISGATIITMNGGRQIILDGALAVAGDRIVAVGKADALARTVRAKETLDGSRFVVTPGFIDGHIHITGDPLTRGFPRGTPETSWTERLQKWVIPIYHAQSAEDERLSAQLSTLAMIRYGTTTFLEAGTVRQLDAVMEGLEGTGIRGRVGEWVEGRAFDPSLDQAKVSAAAIRILESEVERYPERSADKRLACWPLLVGHSTNSDDVWLAAKGLADQHGIRLSAHMSPRASDPDWFRAKYNRRPLEHLADIGAMGERVMLTHLADMDRSELDVLVQSGASAIHCPHAALQGGMGVSRKGLFPEMVARGVHLLVGTDGVATDILSSGRLTASWLRDAREDQDLFPAESILEMMTIGAAEAMGLSNLIGSIEVGKKADFVLHDTDLPEWGPVFDPVGQLTMDAPPSGVHSVWIDGVRVLEAGRATLLDEAKLVADGKQAGRAVVARTGLPYRSTWPVV
ncbi:MAG TPA: amidohydrolase family protein [Alphaproteobacteria bacterium]|nr:amidohydrolase family protein [Alphaproteobacteria bacterium]